MAGRLGIACVHAQRLGCSQEFHCWHVHPTREVHACARVGPTYSQVPQGNMFVWMTKLIQKATIRAAKNASQTIAKLLRKITQPKRLQAAMATTSASFSMLGWVGTKKAIPRHKIYTVMAQQQADVQQQQQQPVSLPQQPMAKSKNMFREYGGQWLSSVTRHVRIYAAYIDPVTNAFDQTQMDKLTLILDPTNEFVWTPETCSKVYTYFQELVDHYEVF